MKSKYTKNQIIKTIDYWKNILTIMSENTQNLMSRLK